MLDLIGQGRGNNDAVCSRYLDANCIILARGKYKSLQFFFHMLFKGSLQLIQKYAFTVGPVFHSMEGMMDIAELHSEQKLEYRAYFTDSGFSMRNAARGM